MTSTPGQSPKPDDTGRPAASPAPLRPGLDHWASNQLLPLVYSQLRRLAASHLAREPGAGAGFTLQPTALVHEAFLRLSGEHTWDSKAHFFAAAAQAMRRILVERARKQIRRDRLGKRQTVTLSDLTGDPTAPAIDMLSLHQALKGLEAAAPRKYEVVMLRFFAGVSVDQTAELLNISAITVKRDWNYARAWLLASIMQSGDKADALEPDPGESQSSEDPDE